MEHINDTSTAIVHDSNDTISTGVVDYSNAIKPLLKEHFGTSSRHPRQIETGDVYIYQSNDPGDERSGQR